jgi:hypothetical protein|uniref:Uncharacterized protein n=1 Tax=viral metagenome TaxID=1070528 RepID=A0A6C0IM39_9ZZZZ
MTKVNKVIDKLYCRLSCYTTVTYKNVINICSCHPQCKLLNTYKRAKHVQSWPYAYSVGEAAKTCDCTKKCKETQSNL